MQTCPSCKGELSERGFHCPSCEVQARCRACREILDLGSRFCVNCGAAAGEANQPHTTGNGDSTAGPTYNIIEFDEDAKSRHFRAKVTDSAIDSVSNPLTLFLAKRMGVKVKQGRQHSVTSNVIVNDPQLVLPGLTPETENENEQDGIGVAEKVRKALPASTEEEQLKEIFHATEDNKLRLNNSRLKQQGRMDFVERLTILFLYAHNLKRRETISRSDLNEVLSDAKVKDGNTRGWIARTDLLSRDGHSIRLSVPGRERAKEVLRQMLDPNSNG